MSRISIFPIKSLPGVEVVRSRVLPSGALAWDRRLALMDSDGEIVNAKNTVALHQFVVEYDLTVPLVRLSTVLGETRREFHLDDDRQSLADYFSCLLDRVIFVVEDDQNGFPDDRDAAGPTIISVATLEALTALFPMTVDELRQRFRTNIEVDGIPAFWEDALFDDSPRPVPFTINGVLFGGTNSCQRCRVPGRHPQSGEESVAFGKVMAMYRKEKLPEWTARGTFDHYYRLATNTVLLDPETAGEIRTGDRVRIRRKSLS